MVRWVVGLILHGVDPFSYFSFQPVLHNWCNKGRGMCYPVCGMVHIKEPLLLIGKSSLCGGSRFPLSQSEWFFTICPTPYTGKLNVFSVSLIKHSLPYKWYICDRKLTIVAHQMFKTESLGHFWTFYKTQNLEIIYIISTGISWLLYIVCCYLTQASI